MNRIKINFTNKQFLTCNWIGILIGSLMFSSCSNPKEKEDIAEDAPAVEVKSDKANSMVPVRKNNRDSLTEEEKKYAVFFDEGGTIKGVVLALDSPLPGMTTLEKVEFIPKEQSLGLNVEDHFKPLQTATVDTSMLELDLPPTIGAVAKCGFTNPNNDSSVLFDGKNLTLTQNSVFTSPSGAIMCLYGWPTKCVGDSEEGHFDIPVDIDNSCKLQTIPCVPYSCSLGLSLGEKCEISGGSENNSSSCPKKPCGCDEAPIDENGVCRCSVGESKCSTEGGDGNGNLTCPAGQSMNTTTGKCISEQCDGTLVRQDGKCVSGNNAPLSEDLKTEVEAYYQQLNALENFERSTGERLQSDLPEGKLLNAAQLSDWKEALNSKGANIP